MLKIILLSTFVLFATIVVASCQNSKVRVSSANPPENASSPAPVDLATTPFQFYGEVMGCGDFRVFRFTQDGTKAFTVKVNKEKLKITEKPRTFDIEATKGLEVFIEDFGNDNYEDREGYCYDNIAIRDVEPIRFIAKAGTATVHVSETTRPYGYKATVTLENVRFINDQKGIEFVIPKVDISDVEVGWIPG